MNSASPTTSNSTSRGGRPKDWTDPRARRLVRLYVYTRLPIELILKLLEDGVWQPGKEAANKVKNTLLGNDHRWMRPKDEADEKRRIAALEKSRRASMFSRTSSAPHSTKNQGHAPTSALHDDDSMTLAHSHQASFDKSDTSAAFHSNHQPIDPGFPMSTGLSPNFCFDDNSIPRFTPWVPNGMATLRQDTGLTNSTETSMTNSFAEKLSAVPRDQAKGAWRVLKKFTFPKDLDPQRASSFSPEHVPSPQFQPGTRDLGELDEPILHDSFSARYAVPGDFLNFDLFKERGQCEIGSAAHKTKTCWCRVADQLMAIPDTWTTPGDYPTSINTLEGFRRYFTKRDPFGNTKFHLVAAADWDHKDFLKIVHQGLSDPHLPVRTTNTAGQTFLHVLHRSWYDDESLLGNLLSLLKDAGFDIMATDVYGRSFFHLLQTSKQNSTRIPPGLSDWNLLKRRDAFGVKPMDPQTSRQPARAAALQSHHVNTMNTVNSDRTTLSLPRIDIPSDDGEDAWIRPQAELLKTIVNAISLEPVNSTTPDPRLEDAGGRNALHCLAEVELDVERLHTPTSASGRHKRQKRSDTTEVDRRVEYLNGLLAAKVDVNHYDNQGQTPLMAFVNRPENSKYDMQDLTKILRILHNAGADLEKRNRHGETALHVAARSGQKYVVRVLLELGANPFVRNAHGWSLLDMVDEQFINSDGDLYTASRLEACRGWISGVVKTPCPQEPTILEEWGVERAHVSLQ
ncbi:ankyrin [Whalleya microplaca]|nr:ankyrin [Whalleya microplaca]